MQVMASNVNQPVRSSHAPNTGGLHQDEQIKSLQKQIENVQKQLQSLADNKNLPLQEKVAKQKEFQQQIQDLNKQISQRKLEIQQEKQRAAQVNNQQDQQRNKIDNKDSVTDKAAIQGIISADMSMKQINALQGTKSNMAREEKVLSNEVKLDKGRGVTSENKEEKLAKLKKQINDTSTKIADQIFDMNKDLEKDIKANERKDTEKSNTDEDLEKNKVLYNKAGEVSHTKTEGNISFLV
jgi:hypothetical protein